MATLLRLPDETAPAGPRQPLNIDAEKALLGALLVENRLLEELGVPLGEDHFAEPLHGRIFARIRSLVDQNMLASPVTLAPLFANDPALAELGGQAYLASLAEDPAVVLLARDCARQVHDLALLRALIRLGTEMVNRACDTSEAIAPREQIEAAEADLFRIADAGDISGGAQSFAQAATRAVDMVARAKRSGGSISGVTTGFSGLNRTLGGLQRSDLVILAGRPAMGKTALATNIAFNAAWRRALDEEEGRNSGTGAAVAFFSLEMSADQLAARILAQRAELNSERLRKGEIAQEEFNRLARAAEELQHLPLFIDDTPALTVAALRTRARRLKRQHKIGLIVVDYLQLLQGTSRQADGSRVMEVSEITRGLKTLAKELDVPVLALSQLSRQVEARPDKRPQLADLRESGTIEQDADIVLFVFREEYYHAQKRPSDPASDEFRRWQEEEYRLRGLAEVIVGKNRHGATRIIDMVFMSEFASFGDAADET
ncbi:replicative DNA helicase [Thermaurantiacus tibetensis]|uniref:replicative DNA helicase n=1 Tax=Thermaurantiacus tibetensis TaxID=2759035 RepID=UPI00188F41E7|nr:replicative DNA helicase [Thermaurantiacus tibetensis]